MLNWTEKQLNEALAKNKAISIDEKHSQLAKTVKGKPKKPKRPKMSRPPIRFYEYSEEKPLRLHIPFVPPSLNKILAMNEWNRRKLKEEFVNDMHWELMLNKVKCFRSPVELQITLFYPVERRRDNDNYLKFLLDSIRGVLIIDDSPEHLKEVKVEFAKGKHHMEIRVVPLNKEASA